MGEVEQLPLFEGFRPDGAEVKLSGTVAARREQYTLGDRVYLLIRGEVVGINHEKKGPNQNVLVRSHKVKVLGAERVDTQGAVADALVQEAYEYLASVLDDEDEDEEPGEATA